MKRIIALALVMVMAFGLAACGAKAEDANTVGTGKLETTEGETIQDVSKLEPAANINPSTLNIGHAISEEHTGDAWYVNGVRGEDYFYLTPADNSSIGLAYVLVEKGQPVKTVVCAMTEDNHLVDEEAPAGESGIDIVFTDEFKAYDYKNETWYVRGDPDVIKQLFIGRELACQDNPTNTIILRADGTGTEMFNGEEDALTWALDSATTVKYNDGEFDYSLEIVTDESGAFISLSEQNHRIFVPVENLTAEAETPAAEDTGAEEAPAAQ